MLDITSTAVALSVLTPSPADFAPLSSADASRARPQISIQLDRRPWPHVAHAGSLGQLEVGLGHAAGAGAGAGGGSAETTVIVYGLEPGIEYDISLDVVGTDDAETDLVTLETETAVAQSVTGARSLCGRA